MLLEGSVWTGLRDCIFSSTFYSFSFQTPEAIGDAVLSFLYLCWWGAASVEGSATHKGEKGFFGSTKKRHPALFDISRVAGGRFCVTEPLSLSHGTLHQHQERDRESVRQGASKIERKP